MLLRGLRLPLRGVSSPPRSVFSKVSFLKNFGKDTLEKTPWKIHFWPSGWVCCFRYILLLRGVGSLLRGLGLLLAKSLLPSRFLQGLFCKADFLQGLGLGVLTLGFFFSPGLRAEERYLGLNT